MAWAECPQRTCSSRADNKKNCAPRGDGDPDAAFCRSTKCRQGRIVGRTSGCRYSRVAIDGHFAREFAVVVAAFEAKPIIATAGRKMGNADRECRWLRGGIDDHGADLAGREGRGIGPEARVAGDVRCDKPVAEHTLQIIEIIKRGTRRISFHTRLVAAAEETVVVSSGPSVQQVPARGEAIFVAKEL